MTASKAQIGGDHYAVFAIQPSEFIYANNLGWLEGNAVKYICRHQDKGGAEDIRKAIHYLELILEWHYKFDAEEAEAHYREWLEREFLEEEEGIEVEEHQAPRSLDDVTPQEWDGVSQRLRESHIIREMDEIKSYINELNRGYGGSL